MHIRDWSEYRAWAQAVADGAISFDISDVSRVVNELLDEIDHLHNRYAHEGGQPQVLTVDVLIEWVRALDVPTMENVYGVRAIPNVFTADFAAPLETRHCRQFEVLGLAVVDTEYPQPGRGQYMLKWTPPPVDERT